MAFEIGGKNFGRGLLFLLLSATFLHTSPVFASPDTDRVAVLDFINRTDGNLPDREIQYISELVRGATRKSLSIDRFLIMNHDNIIALLPPGRAISDCVGECAVETGRKLGAQYVVTGEVMNIGGELRALLNLHETDSGNLLGQERVGGNDILALEEALEQEVALLLRPLGSSVRSNSSGGEISVGATGEVDRVPLAMVAPWPNPESLRGDISVDNATIDTALAMQGQGWEYVMPQPKSEQAGWGNDDRRTTWWVGYWNNTQSKQTSSGVPKLEKGKYMGDGKGGRSWRRGGRPRAPTRLEWLLSKRGGIKPR